MHTACKSEDRVESDLEGPACWSTTGAGGRSRGGASSITRARCCRVPSPTTGGRPSYLLEDVDIRILG